MAAAVSEEELRKLFEEHGVVTSCVVMKEEGEGGKSKGFGFVNFEEPEAAAKAVEALNGKDINGKRKMGLGLRVGYALRETLRCMDVLCFAEGCPCCVELWQGAPCPRRHCDGREVLPEGLSELEAAYSVKHENLWKILQEVSWSHKQKDTNGVIPAQYCLGAAGKELYVGRAQRKAEREALLRAK